MLRPSVLFDSRTHRKCRRERAAAETVHVTQEGGIGTAARLLLFTEGNDQGNLPSLTPFPSDRPIGAALGQTSAAALPRRARRCTDFQHSATGPGGSVVTPIRWFPSAGNPHECLLCGVGTSYFATENWGFIARERDAVCGGDYSCTSIVNDGRGLSQWCCPPHTNARHPRLDNCQKLPHTSTT